jgi:hypothetical protein
MNSKVLAKTSPEPEGESSLLPVIMDILLGLLEGSKSPGLPFCFINDS